MASYYEITLGNPHFGKFTIFSKFVIKLSVLILIPLLNIGIQHKFSITKIKNIVNLQFCVIFWLNLPMEICPTSILKMIIWKSWTSYS